MSQAVIYLEVSDDLKDWADAQAAAHGMGTATWVRFLLLERKEADMWGPGLEGRWNDLQKP